MFELTDINFLFNFWPRLESSANVVWLTITLFCLISLASLALSYPSKSLSRTTRNKHIITSDSVFVSVLVISILLIRTPTWMMGQTNIDEAQWIAGAITLGDKFSFWGTVDGTTSGPLVIHALHLWNSIFGVTGFQSAKVFTTLIWALVVVATYFSFVQIMDRRSSRILICPFAAVVALMHSPSFVGYNGEQLPILILAIASLILCRMCSSEKLLHPEALLLGLILGVLPYTKLQAVPMGLLLGIYGLLLLYRKPSFLTLLLTVFFTNTLILGYLAAIGELNDFWTSYILENIEYSQTHSGLPFIKRPYGFIRVWFTIEEARFFIAIGLLSICTALVFWLKEASSRIDRESWPLWGALGYLAATAFCVLLPGTFFTHYYLFMLHPLILSFAIAISACQSNLNTRSIRNIDFAVIAFFHIGVSIPAVISYSKFFEQTSYKTQISISAVSEKLKELSNDETVLSAWGWAPHFHVQTLLPQATAEAHTFRQIEEGKYQAYFLDRYLTQLKQHENLLFLDATNSMESKYFKDPIYGHENYQQVALFIENNLSLITTINGVRIYRREGFGLP